VVQLVAKGGCLARALDPNKRLGISHVDTLVLQSSMSDTEQDTSVLGKRNRNSNNDSETCDDQDGEDGPMPAADTDMNQDDSDVDVGLCLCLLGPKVDSKRNDGVGHI